MRLPARRSATPPAKPKARRKVRHGQAATKPKTKNQVRHGEATKLAPMRRTEPPLGRAAHGDAIDFGCPPFGEKGRKGAGPLIVAPRPRAQ